MLRKDKRSLALSLVLGDGCLHYLKRATKWYGSMTIDHGVKQADYQAWKASLLSQLFDRKVKVRNGHGGKSVQIAISDKRFRAWRKWVYVGGKKNIARIFPFLRHPEMAVAIWLGDDGYVETSPDKRYPDKVYSARFRIFTCDQAIETQEAIRKWFQQQFDIQLKVKWLKRKSKSYPYLKFTCEDSLKLWSQIRTFLLQFKSMQYKFRHIEQLYQYRVAQRQPNNS